MKDSIIVAACLATIGAWPAGAAFTADPAMHGAATAMDFAQQGNRPQQAQGNRAQPGNRPQQAQGNRAQPGNRPQQAQGNRAQPGNRPQQAQGNRAQPGNRPQQAQGNRAQPGNRPQQVQGNRAQPGNRPQQAQGNRGRGQALGASSQLRGVRRLPPAEVQRTLDGLPAEWRQRWSSSRPSDRLVTQAAVLGATWGLDAREVDLSTRSGFLLVSNRRGDVLLELDDRGARDLGHWDLRRLGDRRANGNAPAFCRTGQGHPVWGREWCLDKGFGLGSRRGTIWSRTAVDDIVFRRPVGPDRLARDVLIGVLGDVVFNRLALHALSLGYSEPLHGYWVAERDGPRILHVYSGDVAVAELVDTSRNDRVDVLYVVQPL